MKRGVSRRRGVRGGDWRKEQMGEALLGGSGVRGCGSVRRSVRRSRGGQYPFGDRGREFMALGGSGVRGRGRGRSVRRSRGGQYDRGREFSIFGGSGVRSRRRVRVGGWRNVPIKQIY